MYIYVYMYINCHIYVIFLIAVLGTYFYNIRAKSIRKWQQKVFTIHDTGNRAEFCSADAIIHLNPTPLCPNL